MSYAEKWVQVNLVNSPGVKLQLEKKHDSICVCCFWVVLGRGQSSKESEGKTPCKIPESQLTAPSLVKQNCWHNMLVCSWLGRMLLLATWSQALHTALALERMAGQGKDGPACPGRSQLYPKVILPARLCCKTGRADVALTPNLCHVQYNGVSLVLFHIRRVFRGAIAWGEKPMNLIPNSVGVGYCV